MVKVLKFIKPLLSDMPSVIALMKNKNVKPEYFELS